MKLACSRCRAVHEYADKPPAFCSACGNAYPPADPDATRTLDLDATGPHPSGGLDRDTPQVIGGYRLLRLLGKGGMGKVYEAEEIATCRRVALKLIAAQVETSEMAVARFRREGQLAATITHPRCVFVHRADEEAGQPYLVLELMPGTTLRDLVETSGPLEPGEAVVKLFDVMDGLGALHQLGIIHRDVKPANCFLDADGRVKVGDFGLARTLVGGDDSLTGTGVFVGTPLFASPEQLKGKSVDVRTDVYSVATTLFYLLTGSAPFQGSDGAGVVARIASEDPPSLRKFRPALPPALDRVVLRGLARDPDKRYQTLDALRRALYPFLSGKRLTFGGMGLRFFATLADAVLFVALSSAVVLGITVAMRPVPLWLGTIITCAIIVLYFGLSEGLLGWTPGKWLLGLRVYGADAERSPGVRRAGARVLSIVVFLNLLNSDLVAVLPLPQAVKELCARRFNMLTLYYDTGQPAWDEEVPGPAGQPVLIRHRHFVPLVVAFPLVATHIGVFLILCTMRQSNGYRGLHEMLSGTRVVRLTPPPRPERVRLQPTQPANPFNEEPVTSWPRRLGPYDVQGPLPGAEGSNFLLGEDAALGRRVLLVQCPKSAEGLSPARKAVSRMTRPRWLDSGTTEEKRWHAFVAPDQGWALPDLLALCPPLPWRETRLLLVQLAEELAGAVADGTLPDQLTVEQVWVQPNGRLLLLDWPVHPPAPAPPVTEGPGGPDLVPLPALTATIGGPSPEEEALDLLRQVAVLALEGKPRPAQASPTPVQARVPLHAGALLARLLGVEKPYHRLAECLADLSATEGRPAEVNWVRLLVYVSVETVLLYTGIMYLPMLFLLTKERDPAADDGCAAFQALIVLVYGLFFSLLLCPPLTVLIAVLTRGGFSCYLTDTALVTRNGQRASRWRCLWRSLLTWVQLVTATVALTALYLVVVPRIPYPIHQSWGAILFYFNLLAFALVGEMLLAWLPRRSLADRLSGTYLVPK